MDDFLRGALAAAGFLTALFSLVTFSLVFQFAPLWGTRASSNVVVSVVLTYLALGVATVAFLPRVRVAEAVGGVGGALAVLLGLGIVHYGRGGPETLGGYFLLVLILATAIQAICAAGFVFFGRTMLEGADVG